MTTPPPRLHVVTGKGGTGKTTVAAALAMALASDGRRVLLCEAEGRQGIARLFDLAPLPYEERRIAVGRGGGQVHALAIDPEAALIEYLDMFYKLGRAGKALDRFGIIDFATTIAPGVRDVLLTGKVYEAEKRRGDDGRHVYDAIVLDAPPTGRITRFLNVNTEVAGLAKVGPIRKQADSIMSLLHSRRTQVHLVTVLEEMPVQETLDGVAELTATGLPVGHVLVNLVRTSPLDDAARKALEAGDLDASDVAERLGRASVAGADDVAAVLLDEGRAHAERLDLQDAQRSVLDEGEQPVVELPFLPDGVDVGALYELAEHLTAVVGTEVDP
ncbi:ArsA-related P-loop ATPase [Solicola sp. PLA-1-18]|uniref:ArsA-related P-loop ATPase n=1 Tax=Solicola sp. PLA-1-18 TaxID=3380532 RepID=UPI003B7ED209